MIGVFEKIQQLISQKMYKEAKHLAEKIENELDRENVLGIIFFYEKNFEESVKHFESALKIDPANSDVLFNYAKALFERENYFESWRYLTRIRDKTWEVYDLLGDTQLKQDNPAMAIHYYKKAFEMSELAEIKEKYESIKSKYKNDRKLAIFCLPGFDNFIHDVAQVLSNLYDLELVITTSGQKITQAYQWADIVWIEWTSEVAAEITNKLPKMGKKILVRVPDLGVDVFRNLNLAKKINWYYVDFVVFSEKELMKIYDNLCNEIKNTNVFLVPKGVNLSKITPNLSTNNNLSSIFFDFGLLRKEPYEVFMIINQLGTNYKIYVQKIDKVEGYVKEHLDFLNRSLQNRGIELEYVQLDFNNEKALIEKADLIVSLDYFVPIKYLVKAAMAMNRIVILPRTEQTSSYVDNDLLYMFPNEIPDIIKRTVGRGINSRKIVEENFSLENEVKGLLSILGYESKDEKMSKLVVNLLLGSNNL